MNDDLDRFREGLACLTEASRFRIAHALMSGPWSVSSLAERVGLSQSCTTRHLQAMERAGLVIRQRDGKRVLYHLRPERPEIATVREILGGGATDVSATPRSSSAAKTRGGSRETQKAVGPVSTPSRATGPEQVGGTSAQPSARSADLEDFLL
jgi:DNA-binding transcriptional ArsR family regulator